jgi:fumarate reductase flavoprotein subunit
LLDLYQPPFYAIKCYPHMLDTMGGIRINEAMEVLNPFNKSIRGLYAAGVATSGWESENYCSDLSGSAMGFALISGRIAGVSAAAFLSGSE